MRRAEADRLALSSCSSSWFADAAAAGGLTRGEPGATGGWPAEGVAPAHAARAAPPSSAAARRRPGCRSRLFRSIEPSYPDPWCAVWLGIADATERRSGSLRYEPLSLQTMHAPRDVASIRLDNALALFDEFVRNTIKHP